MNRIISIILMAAIFIGMVGFVSVSPAYAGNDAPPNQGEQNPDWDRQNHGERQPNGAHKKGSKDDPVPPTPTPVPVNSKTGHSILSYSGIVINEVCPHGQWIEVFNNTNYHFDLSLFSIKDKAGHMIPLVESTYIIKPGEVVVIAGQNLNLSDDNFIFGKGEFNFDGIIRLIYGGVIIDRVDYDKLLPENQSIERMPGGFDTAVGDDFNFSDFIISSPPTPGLLLPLGRLF